jgi:hypothetical protein
MRNQENGNGLTPSNQVLRTCIIFLNYAAQQHIILIPKPGVYFGEE